MKVDKTKKKGRVLVAMSGGVDSSVAAALLVEQGYEVIGATMQVWDYSSCDLEEGKGTCCSNEDVDDARSVADLLGIPFYVLNCEEEFQEKVIDDFVGSYLQGETPIPCVNCNTFLKFDHLIRKMKELNCDYLATGHYAQIERNEDGYLGIVTSEDRIKDQTYFLFTMQPDLLKHLLFPVGDWNKNDLRTYAEEKGLLVARKKDSVGICFIGSQGYKSFLKDRVQESQIKPGQIKLYPEGQVLAEHDGIHNFTYGQRKGLGVSYSEPLYVKKIDPETHEVWLSEEHDLYKQKLEMKNCNWLIPPKSGQPYQVKIRYQHSGSQGIFVEDGGRSYIYFKEPQRAITPGQASVLYDNQMLVGGGWIV